MRRFTRNESLATVVLSIAMFGCNRDAPSEHVKSGGVAAQASADPNKSVTLHPPGDDPHAKVRSAHAGFVGGPPRDITPTGDLQNERIDGLSWKVPEEWQRAKSTSAMRIAQFMLPGPGGDAELLVFRFPGGGGSIEANIDRWKQQFQQPDGSSTDQHTKVDTTGQEDLHITVVDVEGTYASAMPGETTGTVKPDHRMIAVVVAGSGDPYYLKALGPRKTMDLWAKPLRDAVGTLRTFKDDQKTTDPNAATPRDKPKTK